jgi:hypothetical protein
MQIVAVVCNRLKAIKVSILPCCYRDTTKVLNSSGLFLLSTYNSMTMRYVSGGHLNNPVTRANQSREGGRRIEPGGREKSYKSVLLVTAWLHTTDSIVKVSVLLFHYGKGLLCSNIHHQRGCRRQ